MTYQITEQTCECCNKQFLTMDIPLESISIDESQADVDGQLAQLELSNDEAMALYQNLREYLLYWKQWPNKKPNTLPYCKEQRRQLHVKKLSDWSEKQIRSATNETAINDDTGISNSWVWHHAIHAATGLSIADSNNNNCLLRVLYILQMT